MVNVNRMVPLDEISNIKKLCDKSKTTVIFGAGQAGVRIYNLMKDLAIEIDFFVDNDMNKHGQFIDGKEIASPKRLKEISDLGVLIAAYWQSEEITKELSAGGINNYYDCTNLLNANTKTFLDFDKSGKYSGRCKKFCPVPFEHLHLYNPNVTLCCPQYIHNISAGNLYENSIDEIWNSPLSRQIRASVIDGSYCFCNMDICGYANELMERDKLSEEYRNIIKNNETFLTRGPKWLNIGIDPSCNLACKMCRPNKIDIKDDHFYEVLTYKIISHRWDSVEKITLAGSGEVFFSKYYKEIMNSISERNFPALQTIDLYTNANLLNDKMWEKYVNHLEKYRLELIVSVDAYTKGTYDKIRKFGAFEAVQKNLEMISEKRQAGIISYFQLNFCVQNDNYMEMIDFVNWAKELKVDKVWFQVLRNSPFEENIHDRNHPNYNKFKEIIVNPCFKEDWIDISQLEIELNK